jgi:hypothetical protein
MVSRFIRFTWPIMLMASLLGNWGCAGNKPASAPVSGEKFSDAPGKKAKSAAKSKKLEAARKAAEEAEAKAHQLREEKNQQIPPSSH